MSRRETATVIVGAVVGLVLAVTIGTTAGTVLGLHSVVRQPLVVALSAPFIVALVFFTPGPFEYDRYRRERGRRGIALDTALVVGTAFLAALVLGLVLDTFGIGATTRDTAALAAGIGTGLAAFGTRNIVYYNR